MIRDKATAKLHATFDDVRIDAKKEFLKARLAETTYGVQLRKLARTIAALIAGMDLTDEANRIALVRALREYAQTIDPWARAVALSMINEIDSRDKLAWGKVSTLIGRNVRAEIETAPTGEATRTLLAEQVGLIKSLPLEAAKEVHAMTLEALPTGQRYAMIVDRVQELGDITRNRATLIARTETARTASVFMQVRAQHVGSETYTWAAVMDADTRPSHRKLNGHTFRWDAPPVCDVSAHREYRANPGQIFNCRCVAIPNLPPP